MENLGIDGKLLLAQLINFGVVFFIFKKFIAAPFSKFLNEEKNKEKEKEKILKELEERSSETERKEKELLAKAKEQTQGILNDAKRRAEAVGEDIIKKASAEVDQLREENKKQLEAEREKMYGEVKTHIIKTSAKIARETMKGFIDEKRQEEIVKTLLQSEKRKIYEN